MEAARGSPVKGSLVQNASGPTKLSDSSSRGTKVEWAGVCSNTKEEVGSQSEVFVIVILQPNANKNHFGEILRIVPLDSVAALQGHAGSGHQKEVPSLPGFCRLRQIMVL